MSSPATAPPAVSLPCRLRVGFVSDTGLVRERNEDSYALYLAYSGEQTTAPVDAFFAVADGMGGHERGEVASRFITNAVRRALTGADAGFASAPAALGEEIGGLVRRINRELIELGTELGTELGSARRMGSTLTLAVLRQRRLYLGHVGDSRCYRLRAGVLRQLTEDHSWVVEQRRAGVLTEDEAANHPRRNWLTQCMGIDAEPDVFLLEQPVLDGDRYLLCSDGLHGEVSDADLATILGEQAEPQAVAGRLVDAANRSGGPDNVTAVVFDVAIPVFEGPPPPPPLPPPDPDLAATVPDLDIPAERPRRRVSAAALAVLLAAALAVGGGWLIGAGRSALPALPAEATPAPDDFRPGAGNTLAPALPPLQPEE